MPAIRFGAGEILEYSAEYKLLICRQCRYAIQKNALESHLLRHKIYRGERQRLISSISQLSLLEPHLVSLPAPGLPPVDALPILSGFRCMSEGCQHLTVSSKRMKSHWSVSHGLDGPIHISPSLACPVKLQTFFRGTKIRYFEVAASKTPTIINDNSVDADDDHEEIEVEYHDTRPLGGTLEPSQVTSNPLEPAEPPSPANFNPETLTYFHHFMTRTSLTLPGTKHQQFSTQFWDHVAITQALQRPWLMCGLLAMSALHSADLTDDTTVKRVHCERARDFFSKFSVGLAKTIQYNSDVVMNEVEHQAIKIGEHIKHLLQCARWALGEFDFNLEPIASVDLSEIISTIKGTVFQHNTISDDGSYRHNENPSAQDTTPDSNQISSQHKSPSANPDSFEDDDDNLPPTIFERLRSLPFDMAEGVGRPETTQDVFDTLRAITSLAACCNVSYARRHNTDKTRRTAWHAVVIWLINLPDHFEKEMLSHHHHHHPAALVVIAHWAAILVGRAERVGCWFAKGIAREIVTKTMRLLAESGHALVPLVESLIADMFT